MPNYARQRRWFQVEGSLGSEAGYGFDFGRRRLTLSCGLQRVL